MQILRKEDENELLIGRRHYVRHYSLSLDKNRCVGCELCALICPREAIEIKTFEKKEGEKAKRPIINVDEHKCSYCGICDAICPFGAIKVMLNEERYVTVVDKESFPQLIREITVNTNLCKPDCVECQEACPLNLITVKVIRADGKVVENLDSIENKEDLKVEVEILTENCPSCRICELKCPEGAIAVKRIFYGKLVINQEKCPEGCQDCLDVCPITGALYISEEDGKVHVNELLCVYCGVCRLVCPVEGALDLRRTRIMHTPIRSGAWNKALEKLASPLEVSRELKVRGFLKAKESVERRLMWRKT
jgi:4Fe-4S ferredoxin